MPTDPQRVQSLFLAAVERPPSERAALLDRECGADAELRQRVDALLRAHDLPGRFLESFPPALGTGRTPDGPVAEHPGATIGDYRLLEEIGEGGFGVVYLAEQQEPVQRRVALKVLKAGMDTRQVVARFEAERQALALMEHPHIAKVFDGGATDSGRPYFVMELVEGVPITQYCDEHRLTPRERLALFVHVCQAVQHAHQKGIIHRDLKPSNIMVTLCDGVPVPKIIDFGVAKAIGGQLAEKSVFTGCGQMIGTLEYMSPEQARLDPLDVDTRSDVYSLGVVLYELLCGQTPLDRQRLRSAAFDEMLRIIREDEPPKPSTRLSESKDSLASVSAQRQMEPAKLTKAVRGELDWIVMRALDKDRNRRYETASAFAVDLQRYLADEPVQACPPSAAYRLRKFVRRNKGPVAAVSLVLLALVAGIIGTTWGLVRAEKAHQDAHAALNDLRAQQELTQAAEREKALQLALARWNEARLSRLVRQPGQRSQSLDAIRDAVRHFRSLEQLQPRRLDLRNDALASLTLWDVRPVKRLPASALEWADPLDLHYPFADAPNEVSWRRVADDHVVHRWHWKGSPCYFLDVSPNGRYVVGICREEGQREKGLCRVWDSVTARLALEHSIAPSCARAFRPDSEVLALAQNDGSIAMCDVGTGRQWQAVPAGPIPHSLCFHPGGRYLAVSFFNHPDVAVWDLAGEEVLLRLPVAGNLAWSPDGLLLAAGGADNNIYVCTFPGGKVRAVLRGHEQAVTCLKFHPSGRLLASGSHDDTTRLWSFAPGGELVLPGERLAGFSRDGRRLTTISGHGATQWELADPGDTVHYLPNCPGPSPGPWRVVFAPDGRLLASTTLDGVHFWDAETARLVGHLPSGDGFELAFHPEERSLFTAGSRGLMEWPMAPQDHALSLRIGPGRVLRTSAADGRSLRVDVAGTGESILLSAGDGGVDLVPSADPARTRRLGTHDRLFEVAISPDGRWAASTGGLGDALCVWDVARGSLVQRLEHQGEYPGVRFSPDGRWLVSGVRGDFCFWDVGSWERKFRLPRDPRSLFCSLAFTRDGRLMAVVDGRNQVHLYHAAGLPPRLLAKLETPAGSNLSRLSLSPDGTRLAATIDYNNTVVLWNLRRLREQLASLDLDWDMPPYPPERHAGEPAQPLSLNVVLDSPGEAGGKSAPERVDPASKPTPPDAGTPIQTEEEGQGKPETSKEIPKV